MTSKEARMTLYNAYDGKTDEECGAIFNEYAPIIDIILDRELELGRQGWMLGY
jgi:hypothetical protein